MSNYKIEIKWAIVFVVTLLVWSFLEKSFGFHDERIGDHPIVSMFFMIPAILIYVFALRQKKSQFYNGTISFGQVFKSGLIVSLIIALLNPGVQYIISYVISPDYFANAIKHTVEGGFDTQENADAFFTYQSYVIQGIIWAILAGVISTLVIGLFIKSKKA